MIDIDALINALINREGGYTNNPADKGGPTNFGITQQEAHAHGYVGDMRNFPRSKAAEIYKYNYWTHPGFDKVALRSEKLAAELFDTGVNMGPKMASSFLQRALNVLNRQGSDYADINVDGDIGLGTLGALDHLIAKRGKANSEAVLLRIADGLQLARYVAIAEANPSQETFEWGWILNRVGGASGV
jgi:lysozyme family protein